MMGIMMLQQKSGMSMNSNEKIDTCNKILTGGLAFYTVEDPDDYRVNVDALQRFLEVENIFEGVIRKKTKGIGAWGFEDNVFVNSYGVQ